MGIQIKCTGFCIRGNVRRVNQDNLFYEGNYLPAVHSDISIPVTSFSTGRDNAFAVFDGMGGEEAGEVASFLAAQRFSGLIKDNKYDFNTICEGMNETLIKHMAKARIYQMGSTVAGLCFKDDMVCGFNLGDSRVYSLKGGKLKQLSRDHIAGTEPHLRNMLTGCLGMRDIQGKITPEVFTDRIDHGSMFLLCTDGVTKMLSDRRMAQILKDGSSLEERSEKIRDIILRNGAVDNATLMLFEAKKCLFS